MDHTVYQAAYGQPDEAQAATAAVLSALQQGSLSVLKLVGLLQRPLTDDTDHEARAKAVQLLSEAAAQAPEVLKAGDVGVLAEFLGSKLSDWRCVTPAVPGCLALLQRYKQPSLAPLPVADGVKLVAKVAAVHVQGFDYKGRLACYELLLEILQGPFAVPAAFAGTDLVTFTLVAMENEADPRSLQVALQCVEAVGKLYQRVDLSSVPHLHDNLEDLFDVGVVPYFPIIFPANMKDPQGITRDMLRERVIAAMACCPDFAPLAIPVLSEKLGSSLKQAKEDALAALPVCLRSWGPAAVRPHLQAVWLMLKSELMAPAALDDSKQLEQLPAKRDMAAQAAIALQHSTAALGPGLLDQQVLNDVAVEDLMQYLGLVDPPWTNPTAAAAGAGGAGGAGGGGASGTGAGGAAGAASEQESWHLPPKAQRRLACIAACVAVVAAAGGDCTAAACAAVLRPAVAAVLQDTASLAAAAAHTVSQGPQPLRPLQANCGVLAVLHHTLKALANSTGAAAADADAAGEAAATARYTALSALMPDVVTALSQLQTHLSQLNQQQQQQEGADGDQGASTVSVSGLQISQHETHLQRQQLQLWLLLLWKDLLGLPVAISGLQQQQLTAAAQQLLKLALHGSPTDTELELSPGTTVAEQSTAAAALTLLAASSQGSVPDQGELSFQGSVNMQALDSCADELLQLLGGGGSSAAAVDLRQRAGSLLAQLAGSSAAAAWQVLLWLKPVVLGHLQARTWDQLATILPILHNSCLPALPPDLPPQLSAEAAAFCVSLVEAWQQQDVWAAGAETEQKGATSSSSSGHGQAHAAADAVLHSCLLCSQLAARCSLTDQRQLLLLPVCAWITQAAAAAAATHTAEPGVSGSGMDVDAAAPPGPVCVALSVLAAARPGLLVARSTLDVATAAATLAVCADGRGSRSSSSWLDSTAAVVAVGGILNKSLGLQNQQQKAAVVADGVSAAAVQPDDLLAAVLPVSTAPLQDWQQQQQGHLGAVGAIGDRAACALRALSWTGRGLAMQRHNGWHDIMQQYVLPVLLTAPGGQQPAEDSNKDTLAGATAGASPLRAPLSQLVWAAAEFFSVLVAASNGHHGPGSQHCSSSSHVAALDASSLGQNLSLHCMARPLWQQKAFVLALEALTAAGAPLSSTPQAQPPSQQQLQAQGVWLAVGSLVSTAPAALTAAGQQQLLLLRCIVQLLSIWQVLAPSSQGPHIQADGGGGSIVSAVNGGLVAAGGSVGSSSGSRGPWGVSAGMEGVRVLQLLHRCLLMLGDALSDGTQAEQQLGSHVELLLHTLCQLACLQPGPALQQQEQQQQRRELLHLAAAVREVAVMCVTSSMSLPYRLLHPHKRQVMAAVTAALDDDRRAVRKAAVLCRSTWSSS